MATRSTLNLIGNACGLTLTSYPNDEALKAAIITYIKGHAGAAAADIAAVVDLSPTDRPLLNLLANATGVTASNYKNDDDLAAAIVTAIKAAGGATAADKAAVNSLT